MMKLIKDEVNGKILKESFGLRPKIYSCLIHNDDDSTEIFEKVKGIKNPLQEMIFAYYKKNI